MRSMTITIGAALAMSGLPALAQQGSIETRPLEPLFVPGISQNTDDTLVRPVEPLIQQGETAQGGPTTKPAPEEGAGGLLSEGFNDDAFRGPDAEGGENFIDRAFGTDGAETLFGREGEDGGFPEPEDEGGLIAVQPLEPPSGARDDTEAARLFPEEEEKPRFQEAPFASRGLFGPNTPRPLPRIATSPAKAAEIRQLDKMVGTTQTVAIEAGEERQIGRLRVRVEGCRQAVDGGTHGTVAFLKIWDPEVNEADPIFSGWMFAESPALSAVDHPRYDVWLLGCAASRAADAEPAGRVPGEG